MAEQRQFFVSYEGELSSEDREGLSQPGWKLYENGIGSTAAFRGNEPPPIHWRQIVRLQARDADEASQLLIEALGRQPERLHVFEGGPSAP